MITRLRAGCMLVFALVPSLLLTRVHPFGDAGLYAAKGAATGIPAEAEVPADVRRILETKCADCHSIVTRAPAYGHFAPVSWLLERDIVQARRHLNLSEWRRYTPEQQDVLKAKIVQQVRSGKMPVLQYRVVHWSSSVTPAELQALGAWARVSASPAVAEANVHTLEPGDAVRGEAVFEKRCTGCHALTTDREGPRLQRVFGRPAAAVPGFPYSQALRRAKGVWNAESLNKWLTDPDSFVVGSNMDFRVPKEQERQDLIAFLAKRAAR